MTTFQRQNYCDCIDYPCSEAFYVQHCVEVHGFYPESSFKESNVSPGGEGWGVGWGRDVPRGGEEGRGVPPVAIIPPNSERQRLEQVQADIIALRRNMQSFRELLKDMNQKPKSNEAF